MKIKEAGMTIKECYEKVGSDYDGVLKRLGSEALVKRFAVKFLNDPSFQDFPIPTPDVRQIHPDNSVPLPRLLTHETLLLLI